MGTYKARCTYSQDYCTLTRKRAVVHCWCKVDSLTSENLSKQAISILLRSVRQTVSSLCNRLARKLFSFFFDVSLTDE